MAVEKVPLRNALGEFATGVTIVTTRDSAGRDVGLTANSFNSVSLDPPLVLWSLAKTSLSLQAFVDAPHFAVHILAADQMPLSDQFAKRGLDKFSGLTLDRGEGQVPLLTGCAARFHCRTAYQYEGGDHIIFVGEVLSFDHSAKPPLVFHSGSYAVATPQSRGIEINAARPDISHLIQSAYFHLLTPVRAERDRLGITLHEHYVLGVLLAHRHCTLERIDSIIGYTGIHVSEDIADGLVARGLVTCATMPEGESLTLTDLGRHAVVSLVSAAKAIEAELLQQFSVTERQTLTALLERLARTTSDGQGAVAKHMALLGQLLQIDGRASPSRD